MSRVVTTARLRTPAKPPPPLKSRRPSWWRLLWRRQRKLVWPAFGLLVLAALLFAGYSLLHGLQPSSTVAGLRERIGIGAGLTVQDIQIEGREKTPEPLLRA
ncbi:MAG: hypothetical protein JOZ05_01255, partial [Acetobacteraceae bacterium]|nr:hypothetical protein [Acetobacteraceae bacterium]